MSDIRVALSLYRHPWLVDAAILAVGQRILAGGKIDLEKKAAAYPVQLVQDAPENPEAPDTEKKVDGAVAVFPLKGMLLKEDTRCSYGTETVARAIRSAAHDDQVIAGVLAVNSGGGCVDAIPCMLKAIDEFRSCGKPIFVHSDYCCSAAYWIASAAERIFMDNTMASMVGSIGALAQVMETAPGDLEKNGYKIHMIYADESPDKNKAYRRLQEGDESVYKEDLSRIVSIFHTDIKANRPNLAADAPGVLTGDVFYADQAVANGLADGVMTLEEVIALAAIDSTKPNQSI